MSRPIPPAVFALKSWRIKKQGDKFFISPAAVSRKEAWGKGYRSLHAACMGVARKLAEEWTARSERRRTFHRLSKES